MGLSILNLKRVELEERHFFGCNVMAQIIHTYDMRLVMTVF
jgi:hypothetical protein